MTMILIPVFFFVESSWWDTYSSNSNYNYETRFLFPSPITNLNRKLWWEMVGKPVLWTPTRLGIHWPDIMPTESIYFIGEYNSKASECTEMIKWIWGRWSASGLEWGSHSIRLYMVLSARILLSHRLVALLMPVKSSIFLPQQGMCWVAVGVWRVNAVTL